MTKKAVYAEYDLSDENAKALLELLFISGIDYRVVTPMAEPKLLTGPTINPSAEITVDSVVPDNDSEYIAVDPERFPEPNHGTVLARELIPIPNRLLTPTELMANYIPKDHVQFPEKQRKMKEYRENVWEKREAARIESEVKIGLIRQIRREEREKLEAKIQKKDGEIADLKERIANLEGRAYSKIGGRGEIRHRVRPIQPVQNGD